MNRCSLAAAPGAVSRAPARGTAMALATLVLLSSLVGLQAHSATQSATSPPAASSTAAPAAVPKATSTTRPDPLDARAAVAPLAYRSAFEGYRPLAEIEPQAWRRSNDRVREAGGWRAYAREAQQAGQHADQHKH